MPEAERTKSGYRLYGHRDVSVLRFVRQSRHLGFPVAQIAKLMGLWSESQRTSREVNIRSRSETVGQAGFSMAKDSHSLISRTGAKKRGNGHHQGEFSDLLHISGHGGQRFSLKADTISS